MKASDWFINKIYNPLSKVTGDGPRNFILNTVLETLSNKYITGLCDQCDHNGGCDIQDWNNSRADVDPEDPFSCYYWVQK